MNQGTAAFFATRLVGVAMLTPVLSAPGQELKSEDSAVPESSLPGRPNDAPQAVVAKWMDLVLADNVRDSWALTTKSRGLNAQHDLPRLSNKHTIRIDRCLGNEAMAVVVSNTFTHIGSGVDRAMAFWLVKRDGSWLINRSYTDDPKDIDEQLRGLLMGGGVQWLIAKDDLMGTWVAGPGAPGGVGNTSCGSRFRIGVDGTFSMESWGPAGPREGTVVERGKWRLEDDRVSREQNGQRLVSRITWMGDDLLVLKRADQELGDGWSGTHYRREKSDEP